MTTEHKEKIDDLFPFDRRLTDCRCCILGVYKEQHSYECHEYHMRYAEKILHLIREGDDMQEVADFAEAVLRMEDEEDTVTNFWVTYNKENELHVRASYGPFETVEKVPKKENRGKAPMKSS